MRRPKVCDKRTEELKLEEGKGKEGNRWKGETERVGESRVFFNVDFIVFL